MKLSRDITRSRPNKLIFKVNVLTLMQSASNIHRTGSVYSGVSRGVQALYHVTNK